MEGLLQQGISRRGFLKICALAASALALPPSEARKIAAALASTARPRVVWLHFQECTACTEALTRAFDPALESLLLDMISLEYHETLMVAAGREAKELLEHATEKPGYILVVEGSLPHKDGWCTIDGENSIKDLENLANRAALVIAVGSCAAYGGLPKADPNPSQAASVGELMAAGEIHAQALVNLPGCPPIPEVITGTVIHYLAYGALPELDELGRPLPFYGQTVHQRCSRKSSYNAGKFAESFDDEGARHGWCLLHLGCKGPVTHNACSVLGWNQGTSMPMHSGHGCLGCSEPDFWDRWEHRGGIYATLGANKKQVGRPGKNRQEASHIAHRNNGTA
jgi:hydrogenase small subunit